MKVYIGPYKDWIGPYQIAEAIFFWYPKQEDEFGFKRSADFIHKFGDWLAGGDNESLLSKACHWIQSKRERKVKIKIHKYDSWNAHNTLSMIILPVLQQLKTSKHGSGYVDDADVPEHLRSTSAIPLTEEEKNQGYPDNNLHARYEWMLDEVIWALTQDNEDWEAQYCSGTPDFSFQPSTEHPGMNEMVKGPKDTYKVDWPARQAHQDRVSNGFRLMGKYWQTFWD